MNNKLIIKSMFAAFLFAFVFGVMLLSAGDTVRADGEGEDEKKIELAPTQEAAQGAPGDIQGEEDEEPEQGNPEDIDEDAGEDDGEDEDDEESHPYNTPGLVFQAPSEKKAASQDWGLITAEDYVKSMIFFFEESRGAIKLDPAFNTNVTNYEIILPSHMAFVVFSLTLKENAQSVVIDGKTVSPSNGKQYFGVFADAYLHEEAQEYQIVITASDTSSKTYTFLVSRSDFYIDRTPGPVRNLTSVLIDHGTLPHYAMKHMDVEVRWEPPLVTAGRRAVTEYDITFSNERTGKTHSITPRVPADIAHPGFNFDPKELIHDLIYAEPGDLIKFTITPWNDYGEGDSRSTEFVMPCLATAGCPVNLRR